jgi:hypothetical protein
MPAHLPYLKQPLDGGADGRFRRHEYDARTVVAWLEVHEQVREVVGHGLHVVAEQDSVTAFGECQNKRIGCMKKIGILDGKDVYLGPNAL